MANIVNYPGGVPIARSAGSNSASAPQHFVMENTFDASRLGSAAIADTIEVMTIPANTMVHNVFVEVKTAQGTVTIAVGDAADPDGWVAAATVAATGTRLGGGAYALACKCGQVRVAGFECGFTCILRHARPSAVLCGQCLPVHAGRDERPIVR